MRYVAAISCIALALAGCATPSRIAQPPGAPTAVAVAKAGKASENFSASGRFAAKRGDQQGSGQFRYVQQGTNRTLDLFSPTATQLARIDANTGGAKATLSDGSVREASTLSALLRQFIDIPITDEEFVSWLQALPSSSTIRPMLGNDGRVESFRESGWTIVVSGRFDGEAGAVRRMRWTFDAGGDSSRDAQVTWVFDEFSAQ